MSTQSNFEEEIYPNQPLIEVVFEIRFPGELAIECLKHNFWELIRKEYPRILVPHPSRDKALALIPYRFEKEDESSGVMLALNMMAYYSKSYPGFHEFKKEYLRIHSNFEEIFKLKKLIRAGWRYINIIPFVREKGLIPLDRFLELGFIFPEMIPERFNILNLNFVSETDGGKITTKLETLKRNDKNGEALLLDFDYGKVGELRFEEIEEYIDEAHKYTRNLFEELITDSYRQYLRGDTA
jgi:uncharacterized protein (TIGR04255 family)